MEKGIALTKTVTVCEMAPEARYANDFLVLLLFTEKNPNLYRIVEGYPFALLPVANKPILEYYIDFLLKNNLRRIVVVCEELFSSRIQKFLEHNYKDAGALLSI